MINMLQFFQDDKGDFSSMRLIMIPWMMGVLITWMYCSFSTGTLQPLPESVITAIGIMVAGKAVQKKIERGKNE